MTVQEGPGGKGTRVIATRYPVDEGLEAGTEKQTGKQMNLLPEQGSNVLRESRKGMVR